MSTDRAIAPISITLPPLPRLQDRFLAWAAIGVMVNGVGRVRPSARLATETLVDQWIALAESVCRGEAGGIVDIAAQIVVAIGDDDADGSFWQTALRRQAISIITGKEQTDAF